MGVIVSMGAQEVKQFFQKTFGAPPAQVVRAPGRLELLGNHTDYNGGLVMALAVHKRASLSRTILYDNSGFDTQKDGSVERRFG